MCYPSSLFPPIGATDGYVFLVNALPPFQIVMIREREIYFLRKKIGNGVTYN